MKNTIQPFQFPIYQNFIDDKFYNQIKKGADIYIKENIDNFNVKWFCPTTSNWIKKTNPYFSQIKDIIKPHISNYFNTWKFQNDKNLLIDEIWINIASKNAYQEEHYHNNFFSGVLYLETFPDSGAIQFMNPLSTESLFMDLPEIFNFAHLIQPTNSMVLIFPGWLKHRVLPNTSDNNRITIAFNVIKK
tara:strand:- start:224 stop:790 length:567 start_codon:yes stop_codon:yes gene_type:complete